jgi:hypothetical protein
MEEGKALTLDFFGSLPDFKDRLEIETKIGVWQKGLQNTNPFSLSLFGNVFNEEHVDLKVVDLLSKLSTPSGAGTLFLEPAFKTASQTLSLLREGFLSPRSASKLSIEGPCLHEKICPMMSGRDWCHFSIPASVPGKWFQFFSKALGSERHWLKFSYLWVSKTESKLTASPDLRRVISDPLNRSGYEAELLLCEPERARKVKVRAKPEKNGTSKLPARGDLFNYVVIGQTPGPIRTASGIATTPKPSIQRKPAPFPSPKKGEKKRAGVRQAGHGKPKKK